MLYIKLTPIMTELLAFRAPDDLVQEIKDRATQLGKSRTDVIIEALKIGLGLPVAPLSPIEQRLAVIEDRVLAIDKLETQMSEVVDRLDAIDRDKIHPIAPPLDTGLEPVAIDSKRSPESIRDLDKGGTSTSEFTQYVEPLLRAYSTKGRYFRLDWLEQSELEQPGLKLTLQKQAKQLGFKSEPIKIDGLKIRVWLNRDYCLQSM